MNTGNAHDNRTNRSKYFSIYPKVNLKHRTAEMKARQVFEKSLKLLSELMKYTKKYPCVSECTPDDATIVLK